MTVPYAQDFESDNLESLDGWEFTADGIIALTGEANPHSGISHLLFDAVDLYDYGWADLLLDLSDQIDESVLTLDFWNKSTSSSSNGTYLNLFVSGDGVTWRQFAQTGISATTYEHRMYDLRGAIDRWEIALDQDVYIRFRHYGWYSDRDLLIDDVRVTTDTFFGDLGLSSSDVFQEGATSTVTLSRAGETAAPLTAALSTSDSTVLTFPSTVTIPAGESSVTFEVVPINDGDIDGQQSVELTATALGAIAGTTTFQVADDDTVERRTLGGHLTGVVTGHNYIVTSPIIVDSGRTLAIEENARLMFEPGTHVTVTGTLRAVGTLGSPVVYQCVRQSRGGRSVRLDIQRGRPFGLRARGSRLCNHRRSAPPHDCPPCGYAGQC